MSTPSRGLCFGGAHHLHTRLQGVCQGVSPTSDATGCAFGCPSHAEGQGCVRGVTHVRKAAGWVLGVSHTQVVVQGTCHTERQGCV